MFISGARVFLLGDPEGNSFVFPRVLMLPETKSRETSGLERKQNKLVSQFVIFLDFHLNSSKE